MNFNLREPSTKRGIVMLITGATVLYQTFWGSGQIDIDTVLARVDWWLGIGLTIVGLLGFLPDCDSEKRTRATDLPAIEARSQRVSNLTEEDSVLVGVHSYSELIDKGRRVGESNSKTDLPPIELQGRSEVVSEDRRPAAAVDQPERVGSVDVGVRLDVPPNHRTQPESDERGSAEEWHGWNG